MSHWPKKICPNWHIAHANGIIVYSCIWFNSILLSAHRSCMIACTVHTTLTATCTRLLHWSLSAICCNGKPIHIFNSICTHSCSHRRRCYTKGGIWKYASQPPCTRCTRIHHAYAECVRLSSIHWNSKIKPVFVRTSANWNGIYRLGIYLYTSMLPKLLLSKSLGK